MFPDELRWFSSGEEGTSSGAPVASAMLRTGSDRSDVAGAAAAALALDSSGLISSVVSKNSSVSKILGLLGCA